ncbi:MAG: PQQ-dependent sugar dehydrogenase [Planctomycetota bacterium]|nr:PQQ-dependent sugar dehydrogenase [Planctomycetota bacterium]
MFDPKRPALLLLGAALPVMMGATTHEVSVRNNVFVPEDIVVAQGDTVRWVWEEGFHTVTSGDNCTYDELHFDEDIDSNNPVFEWVVPGDVVGEVPYYCRPHCVVFDMVGTITVLEPGEMVEFRITLDGSQVVPPVDTSGSGSGTATLDLGTNMFSWEISFSDLEGTQTAAHFHGAAPYCANAGVQVPLTTGSPVMGSEILTVQQAEDVLAGLWYVNIHTDLHPGGEIRGQVMPAPLDDPIEDVIAMGDVHIQLDAVADGLTAPNWGTAAPGIEDRLYVTDQDGVIWNVNLDSGDKSVFLDVSDRLVSLGIFGEGSFDERGLLGVAFHPEYADNGRLYTYTSEPVDGEADFSTIPDGFSANHQSVITEWQVQNPGDPDAVVDPGSAREVLRIDQPQFNHDGGAVVFGPDEMLYIALGDGGDADDEDGGTDPFDEPVVGHGCDGNGQNVETILGTILRVDPDGSDSANGQYGIPADNPFVGGDGIDEIFAYGFRNPFRISFDSLTGELFAADVGQNDIEEIDVVIPGGNYGWNLKEGSFFFVRNGASDGYVTDRALNAPPDLIDPIAEYDHDDGLAIVGGFVYRGTKIPPLIGRYVHGEFARTFSNDGRLFYLDETNTILEFPPLMRSDLGLSLLGFGEDGDGELYALANATGTPFGETGVVLRITTRPGDLDADGVVGTADLLALLGNWGPCEGCPADIDGDGVVGTADLLTLLANWG